MSTFPTKEKALGMYKKMYTIRKYEESIYYLFLEGIMPGSIHQSTGEEASAVFNNMALQRLTSEADTMLVAPLTELLILLIPFAVK